MENNKLDRKRRGIGPFEYSSVPGSGPSRMRLHALELNRVILLSIATLVLSATALVIASQYQYQYLCSDCSPPADAFYASVSSPRTICSGINGTGISYSGYIGLNGDSEAKPKRSFYWYFEAEENPRDAPIILTIGGGPGTTALMNTLTGQSPCLITANGIIPNPHRWTEHFNLLALDHPIGVGFSYGTMVNNSRAAALDVYDFLQKFFRLFPHLSENQLVVSGGSYGGIYVPHIATAIQEGNRAIAIARRSGRFGIELGGHNKYSVHIDLRSLMLSNPGSNLLTHFRWLLHHRCYNTHIYNSSTCTEMYSRLPSCLEKIELAFQLKSLGARRSAATACWPLAEGDTHGAVLEDVRLQCNSTDPMICHPQLTWMTTLLDTEGSKMELGVPPFVNFTALSYVVNGEFIAAGDDMHPHHLLYEPLLTDGIRVLHLVGDQDANCAWPGIISFLKLLQTPLQDQFIAADDVPWPTKDSDIATVRSVGPGAGNMTYILVANAGHFVVHDQPALTKTIVEHWVQNRPFFSGT